MFNKALNYLSNKRPEKALPLFKKLLKDTPYKEIYLNLGTCYKMLGNDDMARTMYLAAADPLTPFTDNTFVDAYPEALSNLGLLASTYEEDDVAEELYKMALSADPLYYDAIWNLSNTLLRKYCSRKNADLQYCWKLYEYRYKRSGDTVVLKSKRKMIQWNGEYVDHLVIMVEQGFGDQLMFGRYLPLIEKMVGKMYVQCADRMKPIFSSYSTCSDPSETPALHGIGICSLGRLFNYIPDGDWLRDKYTKKLPNGTLDIGVTWSGNPSHANDKYRSTVPATFRPFSKYGTLYTLNPTEVGTAGFVSLDASGWDATIRELGKLDLVICVDTSIAHLCGALGMPCWVLMPLKDCDFRWGDKSMGSDNIWYPSVRVFRNHGSWEGVTADVMKALDEYKAS